jgi:hypothetical protein
LQEHEARTANLSLPNLTAVSAAAAAAACHQARVLIQAGASLTIKDRWGYNALDVAQKVG